MSIINYQSGTTALMLNSEADSGVDNYDYTRILSMLRSKAGFIFTDIELRLKADKTYVDQLVTDAILGTVLPMAANISVADAGNYYAGATVEAALQEVGLNKATKPSLLSANTTWADTDLILVEDGTGVKKMTVATLKGLLDFAESPIVATKLNGWTDLPPWETLKYYKKDGRVYVQGNVGGGALSTNVMQLPVGYRPSAYVTWASGSVVTSGDIYINNGTPAFISIDISFRI